MPASVRCPFCSAAMTAEPGQSVTCTACGATFVAQGGAPPPPPPPAYAPPPAAGPSPGDMPCPMCGEMIKAGARVCRFCKAQLGPVPVGAGVPPPPPAYGYGYQQPMPPRKKSLWWLWLILGIIVVCCGGGVVMFYVGKDQGTQQQCSENVRKLSDKVRDLARDEKEREKLDERVGTDFWRYVANKSGHEEDAICSGYMLTKFEPRVYRGPKKDRPYSTLKDEDPIGVCPAEGHKDGAWVIYKDGRTVFEKKDSEAYRKAYEMLTD